MSQPSPESTTTFQPYEKQIQPTLATWKENENNHEIARQGLISS
jgi:hypothetical protein